MPCHQRRWAATSLDPVSERWIYSRSSLFHLHFLDCCLHGPGSGADCILCGVCTVPNDFCVVMPYLNVVLILIILILIVHIVLCTHRHEVRLPRCLRFKQRKLFQNALRLGQHMNIDVLSDTWGGYSQKDLPYPHVS